MIRVGLNYIRRYGTESTDLAMHALQGAFPRSGVSKGQLEDCIVCKNFFSPHQFDALLQLKYNHKEVLLLPVEIMWIALHESDERVEYDNEIISKYMPFQLNEPACGKHCCSD